MNSVYNFDKVTAFPGANNIRKIIITPSGKFINTTYEACPVSNNDFVYSFELITWNNLLVLRVHTNLTLAQNLPEETRNACLSNYLMNFLSWKTNLNVIQIRNILAQIDQGQFPFKLKI